MLCTVGGQRQARAASGHTTYGVSTCHNWTQKILQDELWCLRALEIPCYRQSDNCSSSFDRVGPQVRASVAGRSIFVLPSCSACGPRLTVPGLRRLAVQTHAVLFLCFALFTWFTRAVKCVNIQVILIEGTNIISVAPPGLACLPGLLFLPGYQSWGIYCRDHLQAYYPRGPLSICSQRRV